MPLDDLGNEHCFRGSKGSIAVDYFRDLFTSSNLIDLESLLTGFPARVLDEMNINLTIPVSVEEIKRAAFRVKGGCALREDGLTGIFLPEVLGGGWYGRD